jgi:flagellar hook-associated protein 3 FlgL
MASVSKVSTSFLFDSATDRMSALQKRLATTQSQMAEGKQVLSPSDAPDKAAAIQRLNGELERQNNYISSLQVALHRYQGEETALRSANDVLTRMKELSLQATNGTQGNVEREAIATEMQALRDQLVSLGNTRDDSGNYLFSGTRVNTPAFVQGADGSVAYQGDQTLTKIPAGVERQVAYTRAGTDVFSRVIRDDNGQSVSVGFFDSIDQMITGVKSGDQSAMQDSVSDLDQMLANLSVSLARTGSDQSVVQSQIDMLEETKLRVQSTLSDVQDLDYTTAVTQMNKEQMALQAAMSSFAKISGMSLFDYIRN